MKITPRSAQEIAEMGLLPKGEYDFEVQHAADAVSGPQSKSPGTEMIKLNLAVFTDSGRKQFVRDLLHPAMEVKLRHFCEAVGLLDQYNDGSLIADHCFGRSGRVKIKITEDKDGNYPPKNEVADYVVNKEARPKRDKLPPKPPVDADLDTVEDDIPF